MSLTDEASFSGDCILSFVIRAPPRATPLHPKALAAKGQHLNLEGNH